MITEIVTFPIPDGMARDEVVVLCERSVPGWKANPDLLRKNCLHDADAGQGGGVCTWKTIEAARDGHGPAFRARIRETFGDASFACFETPIVIDNEHG